MVRGIAIEDNAKSGMTPCKGKTGMIDYSFTHKTGNVMFYPDDGIPYRCVLKKEYVKKGDD